MNSHSDGDKTWQEKVKDLRKKRANLVKYRKGLIELISVYPSLKRKADNLDQEIWSLIRNLDDDILDLTFVQLEMPLE